MNRTTPQTLQDFSLSPVGSFSMHRVHSWTIVLFVSFSPCLSPRPYQRPTTAQQSPRHAVTLSRCPAVLLCPPALSCDLSQTLPDCLYSPVTSQNALRAHQTPDQYLTLLHPSTPLRASHSPSQSPSLLFRPCPQVPETTTRVFLVILHKSQVLVLYRTPKRMKIIKTPCNPSAPVLH